MSELRQRDPVIKIVMVTIKIILAMMVVMTLNMVKIKMCLVLMMVMFEMVAMISSNDSDQ